MQKGVGSVWNQGSWHWEEKNYNKFAHESLKALFSTISLTAGGYEIAIVKCISIEGEVGILSWRHLK